MQDNGMVPADHATGQGGEYNYDPAMTVSYDYGLTMPIGSPAGVHTGGSIGTGGGLGRPGSAPSGSTRGGPNGGMTVHEAARAKKMVDSNAKAIQNRIHFFKKEEEKIWKDLEEVRRQAATIEEGRTRTLEKKLADKTIQQDRDVTVKQNRARVVASRDQGMDARRHNQAIQEREKKLAGDEQRRISQDILRQKRMHEAQQRLANSERAVSIQRTQLEARLKVTQEKAMRLDRLKMEHEAERMAAEAEVVDAESRLPQLEAEEMMCLQRLQNSRIVTQSVLEELETSLGKQSAVTSLLRSKQRGQDHLNMTTSVGSLGAGGILAEEMDPSSPGASPGYC